MNVEDKRRELEKLYKHRIPIALLINVFLSALVGAYLATITLRANVIPQSTSHESKRSSRGDGSE